MSGGDGSLLADAPPATPAKPNCTALADLLPGRRVRVVGLEKSPAMNGQTGKFMQWIEDDPGWCIVHFDNGEGNQVRAANLVALHDEVAAAPSSAARASKQLPLRCRPPEKVARCFRDVRCPYPQSQTAHGKFGPINYSLIGPVGGEVVVCFHGLNGSRILFQDFGDVLVKEAGFRVLSFDLYGHGLSNAPKVDLCCCRRCRWPSCHAPRGRYDVDFYVDQTEELLQLVGLGDAKLNLLGFSLGGSLCVAYAQKFPQKVLRIVAVSPAGFLPKVPKAWYLLKCLWCCLVPLAPHVLCTYWYRKDRFTKQLKSEDPSVDDDVVDSLWRRFVWQLFHKRGVASATLAALARVPWFNLRKMFKEVGLHPRPVLLMWGERDSLNPPASVATEVRQCFSNVQLMVLKNAGHICMSDQPRQAILNIIAFFKMPPDVRLAERPVDASTLRLSLGNRAAAQIAEMQAKQGAGGALAERTAQMPVPLVLGHKDQDMPDFDGADAGPVVSRDQQDHSGSMAMV